MLELIGAIAGWLAIPAVILGFQAKSVRLMFAINASAGGLLGLHLIIAGAIAGGCLAVIAGITLAVQAMIGHRLSFRRRVLIGVLGIILAFLLREPGWIAFLPLFAFSLGRVSEAFHDPLYSRLGLAFSFVIWLIYGALSGSLQAVIFEALAISSILIYLARDYCRGSTAKTE